jgi:hypothetical protein
MTDTTLIVAECRAEELLTALQAAVNGEDHWRLRASKLLQEISNHMMPASVTEQLREIDGRKRAAEILEDVCSDD